jgi:hypothetical protein
MVKLTNPKVVSYKNKEYVVYSIKRGINIPIVIDKSIYELLKKLDLHFYLNEGLMLYTKVNNGEKNIDIYLHEIVILSEMEGCPCRHS